MANPRRARRANDRQQHTGILLGVAGALIAVLLVYQVFLKSDAGSSSPSTPTRAAAAAAPGAATSTTTAPQEPSLPNASFDELDLRDPFEPVGRPSSGSSSTIDTTSTTFTPSNTIATTPTTSPAQNPAGANEISLLDVYDNAGTQTARVQVDSVEYSVTTGQVFASNYQLIRFTSAECADFQHGSATFGLCAGEQSNK